MNTARRLLAAAALTSFASAALAQSGVKNGAAANKRVVLDFYEKAINRKNFAAAAAHLGPRYVQHNPGAADGKEGLQQFIAFLREKFPDAHSEVKRAFVDGDYVTLHVHAIREPGTRGFAIMDIFRLEHGKIVEHWDVRQEIPQEAANANTMF